MHYGPMKKHPIKQYREAHGLTQAELAAQVGASQGFIAQVEGGTKGLSARSAAAWGDALGIDPAVLMWPDRATA